MKLRVGNAVDSIAISFAGNFNYMSDAMEAPKELYFPGSVAVLAFGPWRSIVTHLHLSEGIREIGDGVFGMYGINPDDG